MESSRKIVDIFIETDSESESSGSRGETAESKLTALEEANPATLSPREDEIDESAAVSPPEQEMVSTFYQVGDNDNTVSPEELDSNFLEMDDPLDITNIEDSIATTQQPSNDTKDCVQQLPQVAVEEQSTGTQSVESSKLTDPPQPIEQSPPPAPKPIDPNKEYCFCRQPPDTHSMIHCHQCLEWFHGECVGITRQKAACIKQFYCPLCIDKNPSLVSVFETRSEVTRPSVESGRTGSAKGVGPGKGGGQEKRSKPKKHSRRCGECVACLTEIDCRKCRFCRDMPKYGGRGSLRQKCIKRQCLRYSRLLYAEDPIYNSQPTIQEDIAAELRAVGGDLTSLPSIAGSIGDNISSPAQNTVPDKSDQRKRVVIESSTVENQPMDDEYLPSPAKKKVGVAKKAKPSGKGGVVKGSKGKSGQKGRSVKPKTKIRLSTSDFDLDEIPANGRRSRQPFADILSGGYYREESPKQCLGPGCVFPTRPHSRYCSEECGIQLALRRIRKHLPKQRELWGDSEAVATVRNRENLQRLDDQHKAIKKRLEELDKQTVTIDNHVQRLSSVSPISDDEADMDCDDLTIHCATCSQPHPLKRAMTHFERCFNKLEGMVSFGSVVRNEGTNIFCDKYDPTQKTYCKRLRVLCPEHTKEPKIGPNEVCGCPLEPQFPSKLSRSKTFCRLSKKSCGTHYSWEKLRKAEIDQEKLNLYLRLEELGEQSRLNQWQIDCRGSLLAVMLHHTIDHNETTPTEHAHKNPPTDHTHNTSNS